VDEETLRQAREQLKDGARHSPQWTMPLACWSHLANALDTGGSTVWWNSRSGSDVSTLIAERRLRAVGPRLPSPRQVFADI
jgi:hypothetical protein